MSTCGQLWVPVAAGTFIRSAVSLTQPVTNIFSTLQNALSDLARILRYDSGVRLDTCTVSAPIWTFGSLMMGVPGARFRDYNQNFLSTTQEIVWISWVQTTITRPNEPPNCAQEILAIFLGDNPRDTPVIRDSKVQVEADTTDTFKQTPESCPKNSDYNFQRWPPGIPVIGNPQVHNVCKRKK